MLRHKDASHNMETKISLDKEASFTEVWYEGNVEYEGKEHRFWLVDPQHKIGEEYECEVRWFFKNVPRQVRAMYVTIIELYKKEKYGRGTNQTGIS